MKKYTAIYVATIETKIQAENIHDAISLAEKLHPDMKLIEVCGFDVKSKDYKIKLKLK